MKNKILIIPIFFLLFFFLIQTTVFANEVKKTENVAVVTEVKEEKSKEENKTATESKETTKKNTLESKQEKIEKEAKENPDKKDKKSAQELKEKAKETAAKNEENKKDLIKTSEEVNSDAKALASDQEESAATVLPILNEEEIIQKDDKATAQAANPNKNDSYIVDITNGKIHTTNCPELSNISEANKKRVDGISLNNLLSLPGANVCESCLNDNSSLSSNDGLSNSNSLNNGSTDTATTQEINSSTKTHYVVNNRSKKVHTPGCQHVSTISAANREDKYDTSLDELLGQGYIVCDDCTAGIERTNSTSGSAGTSGNLSSPGTLLNSAGSTSTTTTNPNTGVDSLNIKLPLIIIGVAIIVLVVNVVIYKKRTNH